jgi:hypothetical protein
VREVLRGSVGEGMVRRSAGLSDAMAVVETVPEKGHEREIKASSSEWTWKVPCNISRLGRTTVQRQKTTKTTLTDLLWNG